MHESMQAGVVEDENVESRSHRVQTLQNPDFGRENQEAII
jgi:hypothetical protein